MKIKLHTMPVRSAWDRGVKAYAEDLLEHLEENDLEPTLENMLNGADDWSQWAYGGSGLIYDYDIAKRLCTPSEFKRRKEGALNPNSGETWLDCEARAVSQAARYILRKAKLQGHSD